MTETIESKIRKLEGKSGPQTDTDDIVFEVFLVKESAKKPGTYLRKSYPDGKYQTISDPESLGITPYTPKKATAIPKPLVSIDASEKNVNLPSSVEKPESDQDRVQRIASAIARDFGGRY